MKKIKLIIFLLLGISILSGPFFSRVAVAYSPEYTWTNANNIDAQDNDNPSNPNSNQTYSFSSKTGKEYKYTISNGGCSYITVQAKSGDAKLYVEKLAGQDCSSGKYNTNSITIKGDLPAEIKQNKDLDASNNNPVNCNKNPDDSRCKDQQPADNPCWLSVGTFGWILCPILDFANTLYNWMFGIVRNLLFVPEATYNSNAGLKESWNNMKNIASAIIVLVALVMIAAQIFNFEFISAYTVKKALPRLVIAAIAIQLSWFIFTLLIQITNGVGAGIYNLLTMPFGAGDILNDLSNQSDSVGAGSQTFAELLIFLGVGSAAATGLITLLSPGGVMTLTLVSIGIIISMLVALITLIVRKMLIITLLILSPVALALWILPGTQKIWSMWWQLFSKLLIMFPLIMILFAAGQIFAASLSNIDESGVVGSVNMIMIIVAFFAPLFLIPGTFKAAGGIFGQIVGAINGVGKKASGADWGIRRRRDALRKYNDETQARRIAEGARKTRSNIMRGDQSGFKGAFNKTRARASLGVGGFLPGASKYLDDEAARTLERDDAEAISDAKNAYATIAGGLGGDARTNAQNQILNSKPGGEAIVNGRAVSVTSQMQRVAIADALQTKNYGAIDQFMLARDAQGSAIDGQIDPERQQILTKAIQSDFGTFDARMPELARSSGDPNVDISAGGGFAKAVSNFHDLSDGSKKSRDRQGDILGRIRDMSQRGVSSTGESATNSDDMKINKAEAARYINLLSRSSDLTPAHVSKIHKELSGSMSDQDIARIIESKGSIILQYNPSQDSYETISASTAP